MKTKIESRAVGSVLEFRMRCSTCGRVGVWQRNLNSAEWSAQVHDKSEHQKASA